MIGAGKQGRVYLIDRDDMGKFGLTDNVVQESDVNIKSWSSPAYFNGSLYYGGKNLPLEAFSVSNASFSTSPTSHSSNVFTAFIGTTPSVSANGSSTGIVWALDNSAYNASGPAILYAYDATNLANQLYNSTQAADNRDQAAGAVKFTVPTVADGNVYVGGEYALTVYGLLVNTIPAAPTNLSATGVSTTQIDLAWTDNASNETSYQVERSLDGVSFSTAATLAANSTSYSDTGLAAATQYYYQVVASNSAGNSAPSNIASATTTLGLVAEWTFEEGSGTTAGDATGNDHTGTLVGNVTWTAGEVGASALSFDPSTGTGPHVVVADAADLRFSNTQSFTLGAWVYVAALPGKWSAIVAKSREQSPWYGLWISNTNHWVAGGPTNLIGGLVTTGWHYLALVQDGTANQRVLYVDGVQAAAGPAQNGNGPGDLWIGGRQVRE